MIVTCNKEHWEYMMTLASSENVKPVNPDRFCGKQRHHEQHYLSDGDCDGAVFTPCGKTYDDVERSTQCPHKRL